VLTLFVYCCSYNPYLFKLVSFSPFCPQLSSAPGKKERQALSCECVGVRQEGSSMKTFTFAVCCLTGLPGLMPFGSFLARLSSCLGNTPRSSAVIFFALLCVLSLS
jgi:hypothetical protein